MLRFRSMFVRRVCKALVLLLIAAAIGLYPTAVRAQSVVDPSHLQFSASTDHWATAPDGSTPLLLRYEVQFFMAGASQAFQAESIGKPNPDGNGNITFSLSLLSSLPSPGIVAEARIAAVGPGGSVLSDLSNTFAFSQPSVPPAPVACTYPLSPATQAVPAGGGTASIMVNAGGGCAWTAASDSAWLAVTENSAGSGFGYIVVTAAANTTGSARTAFITVQGQSVTVTQAAAAVPPPTTCSYPLSPATQSVAAGGGSVSVMVNAGGGCAWTAASDSGWLRIISGGGGNGFGYIVATADPNTQGFTRTAVISVAGQWVTVTQASTTAPPTTCGVTVNPTALSLDKVAASASLAVSAASNCAWTAISSSSWLVITAQTGAGNGWISYRVSPNGGGPRVGTINVGGVTVVVSQAGPGSSTPPPAPSGIRILK